MDVLYHASPHKELRAITPQRTRSNNQYIGDYVFATANKLLAVMYLATKGVGTLMNPDDQPWIVLCSSSANYTANDRGGAIYELPTAGFTETPQAGLTAYEVVSSTAMEPLGKTVYDKSLTAMASHGIEIYFASSKLFNEMVANKNAEQVVPGLTPFHIA